MYWYESRARTNLGGPDSVPAGCAVSLSCCQTLWNPGAAGGFPPYGISISSYLCVSGFLVLNKVVVNSRQPAQVILVKIRCAAPLKALHHALSLPITEKILIVRF